MGARTKEAFNNSAAMAIRSSATLRHLSWAIFALLFFNLSLTGAVTNELASTSAAEKPHHLVFGGDQDYPPFEWLDKNGRPQGFNVDLVRAIGKVMGDEVEVHLGPWPKIREGLERAGTVDVSDMFFTEERAKTADFSTPFWEVHDEIFVRLGTRTVNTLDELAGREVLCQQGSAAADLLRRAVPTAKLVTVISEPEALRRLASGQNDYAVVTSMLGRYTIHQNDLRNLTTTGPPLWPRNYCLVTAKNHPQLLADLNEGLAILKKTGRFDEIYDKWFAAFQPRKPWLNRFLALLPWITAVLATLIVAVTARIWILRHAVRQRTRELRDSEQRLRLAVEAAKIGLWDWHLHDDVIWFSPECKRLLGFEDHEIANRLEEWQRRLHPDDLERTLRAFKAYQEKPWPNFESEFRLRHKDGSYRWILANASLIADEHGKATRMLGSYLDMTERKQAAVSLQESESRHRFLFEHNPMPMLIYERGTLQMLAVNEAFLQHYGYSLEESLALCLTDLYPEEEKAKIAELIPQLQGHAYVGEWHHRKRDGSFITIVVSSHDLVHQGRDARVAVMADISERKQVEEELRATQCSLEERVFLRTTELAEAKERAESADRLKSAFLATMSHELRTPLNSIIGFTGIILQGLAGPLNAEQTKQLGMVQGSARHLLALINDVLDISKIEAGQLEIRAEQFDLPATLEKVVALVKPLADKRKLILRVVLSPDVGPATSDRMRVEQVLLNLLNNAVKFTEHGEIILEARLIKDYAFPNRKTPQPAVCLSVTDTGIGIKPEDMEKIFQPFRQIDSGLSRQHEGTGLGLNICRRLANLMGGEICAKSIWGEGSIFTFFLPLKHDRKP